MFKDGPQFYSVLCLFSSVLCVIARYSLSFLVCIFLLGCRHTWLRIPVHVIDWKDSSLKWPIWLLMEMFNSTHSHTIELQTNLPSIGSAVLCFYSKTGFWPSYCQISTDLDIILQTPIVVWHTLVGWLRPRSACVRLQAKPERLCFL